MPGEGRLDIRPRTTGEILDDAWRLALADAPLLLAMSALFLLPVGAILLLLLANPRPENLLARCGLPAALALLLPMTGLGSGACQELFRRRAEGIPVTLLGCLAAAFRRGLHHATGRALVLTAAAPGLALLGVSGWVVWGRGGAGFLLLLVPALLFFLGLAIGVNSGVHSVLAAGDAHAFSAFRISGQEAQRQAGKTAALAFGRLALWLFAFLNLYLFVELLLLLADTLGGFDVTLLELALSLANPVYCIALGILALVLAAPVIEAVNYLLHVDARTRYEGLDLWYRVRRAFPRSDWSRTGGILIAFGAVFFGAAPGHAEDARLTAVRSARQEIAAITNEVQAAQPYPGGARWVPRLRTIADRLDREGSSHRGRFRWFERAIAEFPRRPQAEAAQLLQNVDTKLALIEQSLPTDEDETPLRSKDEINALLPPKSTDHAKEQDQSRREKEKERVRQDAPEQDTPDREGTAIVVPVPGGFGMLAWVLLAGVVIAILAVGVLLWVQNRGPARRKTAGTKAAVAALPPEAALALPEQSVEALWREADAHAGAGRLLEAVRTLYLAVLALLHRSNLIRYERTRTNGEYANQLRPHAELHEPFRNLTTIFEVKFYGERSCQPDDYSACRGIADNLLANVRG